MLKYFVSILLFLSSAISYGQLTYTVDLNSTQTHKVGVTVDVKSLSSKKITYQMPIWAPGAYSVTHYGHYVIDFKAFDVSGNPVPVKEINGDRWEAVGKKIIEKISYSVGDSHKDSTSLYFAMANIDTNFFFANGTCLFGYPNDRKDLVAGVVYHFPKTWLLATPLDPFNKETAKAVSMYPEHQTFRLKEFIAKNYDELADAPVMADTGFQTRTFKDGNAWYDIVLASDRKFEMDSLEAYTHKIVHAETEFFHDTPFNHYTFLIYAPTFFKSPSAGQGALEHANSSDYLLINLPWKQFKTYGPQIIAHEFFHLWNVKRIHSSLLGPFDYTKRVMTTSLWLSEGITDYYSRTIMTRWNIPSNKSFENMLTELQYAMNHSESGKTESLEQLSIDESDFDIGKATIFYSKGTLLGLLLDIEIRSRTNNKKSLDDVMFALNADAKKGKTFKDNELIGKMEKITGLDLQDFYKKYIAGTDSLPLDDYLRKMGVGRHIQTQNDSGISFRTRFIDADDKGVIIDTFFVDSPLQKAGFVIGDTIATLDGKTITKETAKEFSLRHQAPYNAIFEVRRGINLKKVQVLLDLPRVSNTITKDVAPLPDATPLEVAIRHGIVGKDY